MMTQRRDGKTTSTATASNRKRTYHHQQQNHHHHHHLRRRRILIGLDCLPSRLPECTQSRFRDFHAVIVEPKYVVKCDCERTLPSLDHAVV